jgi:methylated-DNA-[protein]-cysteine S-methyltransferase
MLMKVIETPIGALRLVAHGDALTGVYLPTQTPALVAARGEAPVLVRAAAQLAAYFAGERVVFDLPLDPRGTAFQQRVWKQLTQIAFAETCSYGAVARAIGRPSASRAVGAANGKNPLAIIVPCHRVVGASGELTGYAGGMLAKQWLLEHERRCAPGSRAASDASPEPHASLPA